MGWLATRIRTYIAVIAVCVLVLSAGFAASAQAPGNAAGLIVDFGDGRVAYAWVPFDEERINAIDLVERSGLDLVTIGMGGLGDAICQIDDTGCPVGDCRQRLCQTSDAESPFWRLMVLRDSEWTAATTGGSGARVEDGSVFAWAWSGVDPELPILNVDDIAVRSQADVAARQPALRIDGDTSSEDDTSLTDGPLMWTLVGTVIATILALLVVRSREARRAA